MYNAAISSIFRVVKPSLCSILEHSHQPQRTSVPLSYQAPEPPALPPSPRKPRIYFVSLHIWLFWTFCLVQSHSTCSQDELLLWHHVSRVRPGPRIRASFRFVAKCCSIVCLDRIFYLYSAVRAYGLFPLFGSCGPCFCEPLCASLRSHRRVFLSPACTPRNGIAGSDGSSTVNRLRNWQAVCQSGCAPVTCRTCLPALTTFQQRPWCLSRRDVGFHKGREPSLLCSLPSPQGVE